MENYLHSLLKSGNGKNFYTRNTFSYSLYREKMWEKRYPLSHGRFQSPINIVTNKAQYDPYLDKDNPLTFTYRKLRNFNILNDGTTLKVNPLIKDLEIGGGPLANNYQLDHFHFHWGYENRKGSEHRINGKSYDAEIHFVHWNHKDSQSIAEASNYYQGLCVMGVFLKIGEESAEFDKIINNLKYVRNYREHLLVDEELDIFKYLPNDLTQYWTYPGSLTTPPFLETVTWILLKNAIEISSSQLGELFNLYSSDMTGEGQCQHMRNIFRDPQPLNGRIVRKSFQ
ncbi:carbonic anhydrase 7-like isoform X1 [Gordionus sp. m RMFG-2023]|uniref:carbonic anhydrase 7-like isoform X1 n=1 Tax=Gordionus sp. m RMFG-2023 TaxID=3053472 RepID=UPI0031FD30AC